jgi:hypothetical protein
VPSGKIKVLPGEPIALPCGFTALTSPPGFP